MTERRPINFDAADFQARHLNRSLASARRRLGIQQPESPDQEQPEIAPQPAAVVEARTPTPEIVPARDVAATEAETRARREREEHAARAAAERRERELRERVDSARHRFLTMQREREKATSGILGFFKGNSEKTREIQTRLDAVEAEYKQTLEEYKAVKAEEMIFEADRVAEHKAMMISGEKSQSKIMKWYQRLGETRGTQDISNQTGIKKFFNNRTLIGLGLAGIAIATGPVGWVGGSALVARRIWSGFGSGAGMREVFLNMRRANVDSKVSNDFSASQLQEWISTARARASVDGTMDKLQTKENYKEAVRLWKEKTKAQWESMSLEQRAEQTEVALALETDNIDNKISKEKSWNRAALYAGVGMGLFVGSGKMAELLRGKLLGVGTTTEPHPGPGSSIAAVETAPKPEFTDLRVGGRGIEGALLDHLKTEKGAKMMEWLQAQDYNQGITDKGALVHRFVMDYAKDHGYNMGELDGKDLNRLFGADLKVDSNGAIHLGVDSDQFMPAKAETLVQSTEGVPRPLGANIDTPQSNTDLDELQRRLGELKVETPEAGANSTVETPTTSPASVTPDSDISPTESAPMTEKEAIFRARVEAAYSQEKSSYALRLVLEKEYSGFMKQMGLKDRMLDKIGKLSYSQFLEQYEGPGDFHEKNYKLAEFLKSIKPSKEMSIKDTLIAVAVMKRGY